MCARDDQGRLPLHWAAASGCAELAQALLDAAQAATAEAPSTKDNAAEPADPLDGKPVTEARVSPKTAHKQVDEVEAYALRPPKTF